MENMFSWCKKLKNLDVKKFNTTNVETMSSMCFECKNLTYLDIKNFNFTKVTILNCMFYNCSNLEILYIKNFNIQDKDIYKIFDGCTKIIAKIKKKKDDVDENKYVDEIIDYLKGQTEKEDSERIIQ